MANKQTKAENARLRKEGKHFHGKACNTSFYLENGVKNPAVKKRGPAKIGSKSKPSRKNNSED